MKVVYTDDADVVSLEAVFHGRNLIVVVVPTTAYTEIFILVAIQMDVDYLDVPT
jgi:hypothetical protein